MEQNSRNWNASGEREVDLLELLWKMLESWRLVIVLAVVCALLGGGFSYVKSAREARQLAEAFQPSETQSVSLSDTESEQVENAKKIQRQLDGKLEYQRNSLLMNLDPYHEERVALQYRIVPGAEEDVDSVDLLVSCYQTYLDSRAIAEALARSADASADSTYLGELVSYAVPDVNLNGRTEISFSEGPLSGTGADRERYLQVNVKAADADEVNRLSDSVEQAMKSYHNKMEKKIAAHDLVLSERYRSTVIDTDLAQKQIDLQSQIEGLQSRLNGLTANFTDTQKAVLASGKLPEAAVQGEQEPDDTQEEVQEAPRGTVSKKMVLIGLVLGIVLACVIAALRYILDGCLKSEDELQNGYGLRVLGSVKMGDKKKRLFSGIDRWLASLHDKTAWTAEEQTQMLLANISVLCRKEQIEKIFLTSASLGEAVSAVIRSLTEMLRREGLDPVYETNIACNAASLKTMAEVGNAILIVRGGQTRYKEFEKELTLCCDQEINVLGVVYLY